MSRAAETRWPLARRVRFALLIVGVACIAVTAGVFYTLWSQQTLSLRLTELRRQVGVAAAGVAVTDVIPGSVADTDSARARLLKVEAGLIAARLSVADASGKVLYSTAGTSAVASYPIAALPESPAIDARSGVLEFPGIGRVAIVAVPVAFASAEQPTRYLVGARSLADLGAADRWVALAILAAAVVGLVAAWLLGSVITQRVTGPIVRLTEGSRAVAAGEWGRQVPVEGDDEVAELASAFNEMSRRVGAAYRAQQEFVADVSHELRTPVTSIRGFADAIVDGTVSGSDGINRAASIISSEAGGLAEITATLLALADLDAGTVTMAREPVDVRVLAAALRDRFAMAAADSGALLDVDLDGAGPLADSQRVLQALSTLVDNAIRHASPEHGHVRVRAHRLAGRWWAEVDDDGEGVPPHERERVFGRFTRLDAARGPGGSGLGLAICRRIVELMGGRVWADASPDLGGARFVIELPLPSGMSGAGSTETQCVTNALTTRDADTDL